MIPTFLLVDPEMIPKELRNGNIYSFSTNETEKTQLRNLDPCTCELVSVSYGTIAAIANVLELTV